MKYDNMWNYFSMYNSTVSIESKSMIKDILVDN